MSVSFMRFPWLTTLRTTALCTCFLCPVYAVAEPFRVTFLHSYAPVGEEPKDSISNLLRYVLSRIPDSQLQTEFHAVGRGREWQMLKSGEKVCSYNKVRNAERERSAVFSDYPISVFPPNRLIAAAPNTLPDIVALEDVTNKYDLTLGHDQNRRYGPVIDKQLHIPNSRIYPVTGEDADVRLLKMLMNQKIDALIEFTVAFDTRVENRLAENEITTDYSVHRIEGATTPLFGFVACAKHAHGYRTIGLINEAMSLPDVQDHMLEIYARDYPEQEFLFLMPELLLQYGIQSHAR